MSPNEVEDMYLSRAEDLVTYWAAEARSSGASSSGGKPMSLRDVASKFGGKVVRGG